MFAGEAHPGTSHGEQVGVATLTMSKLQNQILGENQPPTLRPTEIPTAELRARFGAQADEMIAQSRRKALDGAKADALNLRLRREWPKIAGQLRAVMLPYQKLCARGSVPGDSNIPWPSRRIRRVDNENDEEDEEKPGG
jgi:glycerol-1-phosphate dehydrogenase [NAD(P)+]